MRDTGVGVKAFYKLLSLLIRNVPENTRLVRDRCKEHIENVRLLCLKRDTDTAFKLESILKLLDEFNY